MPRVCRRGIFAFCSICGAEATVYGKAHACLPCLAIQFERELRDLPEFRRRLRHYQLSPSDYATLKAKQKNRCKICRRSGPLVIDHDHETGAVRGLLCSSCNLALGLFGDDVRSIRRAYAYVVHSDRKSVGPA